MQVLFQAVSKTSSTNMLTVTTPKQKDKARNHPLVLGKMMCHEKARKSNLTLIKHFITFFDNSYCNTFI